jgi:uncharacterized protein YggT (Ycf19 family)
MITVILLLIRCYMLIIVIRVLLSWMPLRPSHPAVALIGKITEPVLSPVRRLLPTGWRAFDISPLVVLLALGFLVQVILRITS